MSNHNLVCFLLDETGVLKAEVSEEILKWHCHSLSLSAEFESVFCDLLASVGLINKN